MKERKKLLRDRKVDLNHIIELKLNKKIEEIKTKLFDITVSNGLLRHALLNDFNVITSALRLCKRKNRIGNMLVEIKERVKIAMDTIDRSREIEKSIFEKNLKRLSVSEVADQIALEHPNINFSIKSTQGIIADEAVYEIFNNLVKNAIRHGKAKNISIKSEYIRGKNKTLVKICNDGEKIEESIINDIFKEGVKGNNTGNTGIGLYVVKETMIRYGGNVSIKNNENGNVSFLLEFQSI